MKNVIEFFTKEVENETLQFFFSLLGFVMYLSFPLLIVAWGVGILKMLS